MAVRDRISETFDKEFGLKLSEEVLSKCAELCIKYRINEDDLLDEWLAYSTSNDENDVPSLDALVNMEKKGSFKTSPNSRRSSERSIIAEKDTSISDIVEFSPPKVIYSEIPDQVKPIETESSTNFVALETSSLSLDDPTKEYSSRKNSGQVVCTFGNNVDTSSWIVSEKFSPSVLFSDEFNPMPSNVRYMFCTMLDKIQASKNQEDALCSDIIENNNLKSPLEPDFLTMDTATFAGKILCDGRGKLNANSLLLEGRLIERRKDCVKLEVNDTPEYSLFPGQAVVVEGINPEGKRIIAEKIYTDAKPRMYPDFDSVKFSREPLQIVIACGPYMLSNGSYKPFVDLKKYVIDNQPHVLILAGPFIDIHNLNILQFGSNENFTEISEKIIQDLMHDLEGKHTRVIIVSNWKEASLHIVYPTPPIGMSMKCDNLTLVPDPSILDISGFHIGITSTDILLHLSPEELCLSNTSQNVPRLCRIASHLLKQKSFYPLKPSHDDMSIDTKLLVDHAAIPRKPHILVLPSNLKNFINVADDCVIINPERMAKGEYGGSFARIQVRSAADGEEWSPATHTTAQVVKI